MPIATVVATGCQAFLGAALGVDAPAGRDIAGRAGGDRIALPQLGDAAPQRHVDDEGRRHTGEREQSHRRKREPRQRPRHADAERHAEQEADRDAADQPFRRRRQRHRQRPDRELNHDDDAARDKHRHERGVAMRDHRADLLGRMPDRIRKTRTLLTPVYCAARSRAPGNVISTSVPSFGVLLMWNVAWLASASALVSGSPSPVPPGARARRGRDLPERLERGREVVLAHADAGVAHPQHHLAGVGDRGRDDHLPARDRELDRVREQIEHDLAHRARVRHHLRQPRRQRGADDDALAVGLRLHDRDALLGQVVERDAGEGQVELAGLDLGEIEQVVDQRDQVRRPRRGCP